MKLKIVIPSLGGVGNSVTSCNVLSMVLDLYSKCEIKNKGFCYPHFEAEGVQDSKGEVTWPPSHS